VLSDYHVIVTLDKRKKSKMRVISDWHVIIEYWILSSIRVIFVDYQTSELQYNYYSYIQGRTIGDAQIFSNIASIALSGGFSGKILIEVRTLL